VAEYDDARVRLFSVPLELVDSYVRHDRFSWTPDPSPSPPHVMGHQQQQPQQQQQAPQQPSYHPAMHLQASTSMPHAMQHGGFNPIQIASMF
jgi:hypothetical protein